MKKQLLFMALAGLSFAMVSAADLHVRNLGAGGSYATVSAAINAAADGDRIIIQPKTTGAAYVENLTVNKSLTFVSETMYNRYFIQGTINITPAAARVVTFNNLSSGNFTIYNVIVTAATTGGRTTLNLYNCFLNNVDATQANTTTNMSGCTVGGYVLFSHGRITGNRTQSINAYNTSTDTVLAADDVEIIGNSASFSISNQQSSYNFKMDNNFTSSLNVYTIKNNSTNEMINNTVHQPNGGDLAPIYVGVNQGNTGTLAIMNNAVSFTPLNTTLCIQSNGFVNVTASYNVFTNTYLSEGVTSESNNTGNVNMNFDDSAFTISGMNVNAGNPSVLYTDLDLTRNDAGHYGGSNSWANYWGPDSGAMPQINYLVTPRTILNTSTLNVSGSGFSK